MSGKTLEGGCFCGGVRYSVELPAGQVLACHCTMCRRTVGADFGSVAAFNRQSFKLLKKDSYKEFASSDDVRRFFCSHCGCSIGTKHVEFEPNTIWVALATLDDGHGLKLQAHLFAASKGSWVDIAPGTPQCDAEELWKPDTGKRD